MANFRDGIDSYVRQGARCDEKVVPTARTTKTAEDYVWDQARSIAILERSSESNERNADRKITS